MRISDWSSDVCSSDLREQSLPQVGPSLLVGADPHPGGGVVGDGDLRGSVVDDLPQLGADQPEVVALQQAGGVGLVDEVFPDQPAADAERAQYVVQGQALLRAPGPGGPGGVEVGAGGVRVLTGDPAAEQPQAE